MAPRSLQGAALLPPFEKGRAGEGFTYADQMLTQARVNHLTQSLLAKAFANHIPVVCPSGQPPAVQNRSRRLCRGELTAHWRAQNPELIAGENSAAALLQRIQAEREALVGKSKTKKAKSP